MEAIQILTSLQFNLQEDVKEEQSILETREEAEAEGSVAAEAPTSSANISKATGSIKWKVTAPVVVPQPAKDKVPM